MHIKFDDFWILNLNNFVNNNRNLMKFAPFMQSFIENLMQLADH